MPDEGIVGGSVAVATSLISRLSPALLVLIVLNVVGIGAVMWHESSVVEAEASATLKRMEGMTELLKACINGSHPRE